MAAEHTIPPLDGSLTVVPGFVDFHAEHNPSRPWVVFPSIDDPNTLTEISYLELAKASHRVAHALRPNRSGDDGEVVAVLIHCDTVLYIATLIGMVRAGLVPFPISPRNPVDAIVNMMEKTSSHRILTNTFVAPLAQAVKAKFDEKQYDVKIDKLPSIFTIFPQINGNKPDASDITPYPPSAKKPEPNDVVWYLHSSGSTGIPKPIPQTQKIVLQWTNSNAIKDTLGTGWRWGSMMLPSFHTMGIYMQLLVSVAGANVALFTPQEPAPPVMPSPQSTLEVAIATKCKAICTVPAFLEAWAQSEQAMEFMKTVKVVAFAGGPLSEVNGKKYIDAGVQLVSVYGGTEFGATTTLLNVDPSKESDPNAKTRADWAWFQFADYVKLRWVDQGDGTYELHYLTCETHQPGVENLPDTKGYATSDIFEPHPTKKGLWRIVGRTDDVIVLGNGEKIVPIPQESYLCSLPFVQGAIMFGRGRNEAGVLIEPRPEDAIDPKDQAALAAFRNRIWPFVEEANKLAPTFARIFKEMILVTDPAKPLPRAGKGTVQRKLALQTYKDEIEQLYDAIADSADAKGIAPPQHWTVEEVLQWLSRHVTTINDGQEVKQDLDMFEQGLDSLSATFLRNRIIGALRNDSSTSSQRAIAHINQDFVYKHPTVNRLAHALVSLVNPSAAPVLEEADGIHHMIEKYTANLPPSAPLQKDIDSNNLVVVLTGSTGALGSHILAALLKEDRIKKVYTLNRGSDVASRQNASFVDRQLPVQLLDSAKLVQLSADLNSSDLGLAANVLTEIKSSATHIIHNAWRVDFNLSLGSFEPYIAGTRNLIDLTLQFSHRARFLFSSSISVANGWSLDNGPVPESVIDNFDALSAAGQGYASSKFVVEHILAKLNKGGLVPATSLRIGQVSGSTRTGAWNTTDWVPTIIKSSLAIGALPELNGSVSWIPMETTAQTIVDFVLSPASPPEVLNIIHPHPVPWNQIFRDAADVLGQKGASLSLIPYEAWLSKIEERSTNASAADLEQIPAIKLLAFLRQLVPSKSGANTEAGNLPSYSTQHSQQLSTALRNAPPLDRHQVELWIKYWSSKAFIVI
ncbi:acetyl-CoA synthetase-like protein [Panus rudis PR-1116 ss-1]|nr:acetyl-CoA synthetase-like protein [Panus rudis PR-1116 ss-1]